MYEVVFYENKPGFSELYNQIDKLKELSDKNKDARIQHRQINKYINLLQENGTYMDSNITKYLGDGIWELRPGNNRILYFFANKQRYVLLHMFRKKSQKTPKAEIEKAKREKDNYLKQEGNKRWLHGKITKNKPKTTVN